MQTTQHVGASPDILVIYVEFLATSKLYSAITFKISSPIQVHLAQLRIVCTFHPILEAKFL